MNKQKDSNIEYLRANIPGITGISRLEGDASNREFYRIQFTTGSQIAMLYPRENFTEIRQISRLSKLFHSHGINTPQNLDVINQRIVLQQDLGNRLLQECFSRLTEKEKENILSRMIEILKRLGMIDIREATAVLDHTRMKWEMNFFIRYFCHHYMGQKTSQIYKIQNTLHGLVDRIGQIDRFAHRDFHSRNMLIHRGEIYLVDFQDAMQAPRYYDLVSFLFDSYLDLTPYRNTFLSGLSRSDYDINEELLYLTALQRNVKALGTFGYQVKVRKNLKFKKYIPATIKHLSSNPFYPLIKDLELF